MSTLVNKVCDSAAQHPDLEMVDAVLDNSPAAPGILPSENIQPSDVVLGEGCAETVGLAVSNEEVNDFRREDVTI